MPGLRISFRTRILLVVLGVALAPVGLAGLWLTGTTARAGEALLADRLEEARAASVDAVVTSWIETRGALLDIAEDLGLKAAILDRARGAVNGGAWGSLPPSAGAAAAGLGAGVVSLTIRGPAGEALWTSEAAPGQGRATYEGDGVHPRLGVALDIWEGLSDHRIGVLEAELSADAILPLAQVPPEVAGMVLGILDPRTGRALRPLPLDASLLDDGEFDWGGERWRVTGTTLTEPPVRIAVAAPVSPFAAPFRQAAGKSAGLILGVMVLGLLLAWGLARRLTGSLEALAGAARAVAGGDLAHRAEVSGEDEVGQVARAFNTMTENLESTLAELSRRKSLAAVGEFAATLAHEVRNPLTAIRVDLQRVDAGLPGDSPLRLPQERALKEIARLNETVERTLTAARAGRVGGGSFDLREPLRAAAAAAGPAFEARKARLAVELGQRPVEVSGDAAALEQLFLNLLLNAAHALGSGGRASVRLEGEGEDDTVTVLVEDGGVGIPPDLLGRVFDPLFTTAPEGTGLGLTVARRIVEAHRGAIELTSTLGTGTRVRVRLPTEGCHAPSPGT